MPPPNRSKKDEVKKMYQHHEKEVEWIDEEEEIEEEEELDDEKGQRVPKWIKKELNHEVLDAEAEYAMFEKGESEWETIFKHNKKLCMQVVNEFRWKQVPIEDLYQEACIEMWEAIKVHDHKRLSYGSHNKKVRLSNHYYKRAYNRLRKYCLNYNTVVHVPEHLVSYVERTRVIYVKLLQDLQREPTDAEIMAHEDFAKLVDESRMRPDALFKAYRSSGYVATSLNVYTDDISENMIIDLIRDEHASSFRDNVDEMDMVNEYLRTCNITETKVIKMLYLYEYKHSTVANLLKKNSRTIRRYRDTAIDKIREHILTTKELFERVKNLGYIKKDARFGAKIQYNNR